MLHELLLALLGFTGDFVIDEREQAEILGLGAADNPLRQFPDEPTFRLAPDLSFLHPSERNVIQRLISLGFYYRELDHFATKSRNLSFIQSTKDFSLPHSPELLKGNPRKGSIYRRAIANGIVEILSVYRAAVLQVEQNLLSDPLPILATVTQGLNKVYYNAYTHVADSWVMQAYNPYRAVSTVTMMVLVVDNFEVLLPPLYELIVEIEREDIRGGQLLNLLHKRCHCGIPELQACIQRRNVGVWTVFLDDLNIMGLDGHDQKKKKDSSILQDQKNEGHELSHHDDITNLMQKSTDDGALTDWHLGFHISLARAPLSSGRAAARPERRFTSAQKRRWRAASQRRRRRSAGLTGRTIAIGRRCASICRRRRFAAPPLSAAVTHRSVAALRAVAAAPSPNYTTPEMLPEYISMRVAESILFAGKAVKTTGIRQSVLKGSCRVQGFLGTFVLEREIPQSTNLIAEDLLPQSEADKIDAMLKELKQSSEFQKRLFESAISSIRTIAANHLWQCFLEESQLMRLPPHQSTAEADLMVPFQLAALKTVSDEDKYFSRVSLRMPSFGINMTTTQVDFPKLKSNADGNLVPLQGRTLAESSLDGWDGVALEYSVDWPLQLFFTQEVISKYRKVFQYLIRLKRTQMELEKSWAAVMHQDHIDFANNRRDCKNNSIPQHRRRRSLPMWRVREHMTFLIRNLQFYIQVDVIESQWNVLQAHLQDSRDFTELVGFHQEYLAALISQSFLDIGSVSRILDSIMKLCLQFCWIIEQYESNPNISKLEHITEEFNKKSNSLYTILRSSRLAGSQRAPFLRQFLMRLNFNSFFEQTARGVLNVVKARPAIPFVQQE
ncbi:Spc97 / Spc98 family [Musa troglodytarum]|nr:Spc97 / Spc98 family [Musa troglodytarum]URE26795.1 Spc97 / Spc98 family [Musa troglodytarum]